jgi:hypothetical protein
MYLIWYRADFPLSRPECTSERSISCLTSHHLSTANTSTSTSQCRGCYGDDCNIVNHVRPSLFIKFFSFGNLGPTHSVESTRFLKPRPPQFDHRTGRSCGRCIERKLHVFFRALLFRRVSFQRQSETSKEKKEVCISTVMPRRRNTMEKA